MNGVIVPKVGFVGGHYVPALDSYTYAPNVIAPVPGAAMQIDPGLSYISNPMVYKALDLESDVAWLIGKGVIPGLFIGAPLGAIVGYIMSPKGSVEISGKKFDVKITAHGKKFVLTGALVGFATPLVWNFFFAGQKKIQSFGCFNRSEMPAELNITEASNISPCQYRPIKGLFKKTIATDWTGPIIKYAVVPGAFVTQQTDYTIDDTAVNRCSATGEGYRSTGRRIGAELWGWKSKFYTIDNVSALEAEIRQYEGVWTKNLSYAERHSISDAWIKQFVVKATNMARM